MANNPFTKKVKKSNPFSPKKATKTNPFSAGKKSKPAPVKAKKKSAKKSAVAVNPFSKNAGVDPRKAELRKLEEMIDRYDAEYEESFTRESKIFRKLDRVPRLQRGGDRYHTLLDEWKRACRSQDNKYKSLHNLLAAANRLRKQL